MPTVDPSQYHPDLTIDRLHAVAHLLWDARAQVADAHLPELGDDNYVLGTRGWSACRFFLLDMAVRKEWPWFGVVDPLRPTFRIGVVPVGFYRGQPDQPHSRTLRQSNAELLQNSFIFGNEPSAPLTWRFAITLSSDGSPDGVAFVGFNAGGQQEAYIPMPIEAGRPTLRVVESKREPPTGTPKPAVRMKKLKSDEGRNEDAKR